jgi:1-acyl-sn-glycerol-3-phosphate acyltransferase
MSEYLKRKSLAAVRVVLAVWHVVMGAWEVWRDFGPLDPNQRMHRAHLWAQRFFKRLHLELQVEGLPHAAPTLWVANHISWLDIMVLLAAAPCRLVSKSDVKAWPVIGHLADSAGTLFIERRQRRDAMRVVHDMAAALTDGQVLAVFPEGTTSNGEALLPFHANLLQSAIHAQVPVQPVAITYWDLEHQKRSLAPAYVGSDTLVTSLWRCMQLPRLGVKVRFLPPETQQGRDRRVWSVDLHQRLAQALAD